MTKFELTVNGKTISFHIGLGFLGEYQYKNDISIDEVIVRIQTNPWKFIPEMMYESAVYRAKRDNKKLGFNQNDLLDWIDDDGGFNCEGFRKFLEYFVASISDNVPSEDVEEKDNAKKK